MGAMSGDEKSGGQRRKRAVGRPVVPSGPLADLKNLVYELYLAAGTPTLDLIAARTVKDQTLAGAPGRDTVGRIIGGADLPPSQADLTAVVTVLALAARADADHAVGRARDLWIAALADAARVPPCAVRVSDADPRRLGVHAAISVPGAPDGSPPEYVPRDADGGEDGVRAKVKAAAEDGGFVLLVGGSSVGKTRSAYEAVTAALPDWWLVHPAGPSEVAALAAAPTARTVVWLDEFQHYLDGEHGLAGGTVRVLLNAPHPVVIIATIWPDLHADYTAARLPGRGDLHGRAREVLGLATVIRADADFSEGEMERARGAAARDRRLAVALGTADYGLTQTLAAAPQLIARWHDAQGSRPYAWAVLTAALDAARLGARAPLSADFLRAAAPGYCTSRQQAQAPDDWFEQALTYATAELRGAASALAPAGVGMGQIVGYAVAEYLAQHAARERRPARVPASTWEAMLAHVTDNADSARFANSAARRLLYGYAIPLYRRAADSGDEIAADQLVGLLYNCGDFDEAFRIRPSLADVDRAMRQALEDEVASATRRDADRRRARQDDSSPGVAFGPPAQPPALPSLGEIDNPAYATPKDDDLEWLLARADSGEQPFADLADVAVNRLLMYRRDLDGLLARADAGCEGVVWSLATLLASQGRAEEAGRLRRFGLNPDGSIADP